MLTADVFRDNALDVVLEHGVLPNVGSPGMIARARGAGYRGPIAVRVNPGFGHGHVQSCDTGGPSSKHGIWHEDLSARCARWPPSAGCPSSPCTRTSAPGPSRASSTATCASWSTSSPACLPAFPDVEAVNFGGGIPHPYRPGSRPTTSPG